MFHWRESWSSINTQTNELTLAAGLVIHDLISLKVALRNGFISGNANVETGAGQKVACVAVVGRLFLASYHNRLSLSRIERKSLNHAVGFSRLRDKAIKLQSQWPIRRKA